MASGYTNRDKFMELGRTYRGTADPTNYYLALVKSTPTADTNLMSDLTQIALGNGYADGGLIIALNATDWDVHTEDDGTDIAFIQLRDFVWTASGGDLPSDSIGATYAVLTDDNVTVSAREVYTYWDLGGARVVSTGQTLTLQDCELRLTE